MDNELTFIEGIPQCPSDQSLDPILYHLSLSNGMERQPPVGSIMCDGVAVVHHQQQQPCKWTRGPTNGQEDQEGVIFLGPTDLGKEILENMRNSD